MAHVQNLQELPVLETWQHKSARFWTIFFTLADQIIFNQMQIAIFGYSQFVDAPKIVSAGTPVRAKHIVALVQEKLGEIGAILACYACNQCSLHNGTAVFAIGVEPRLKGNTPAGVA